MNNNEKVKLSKKSILIMIFSLVAVIITGTFAWLTWRSQNTAMVLTIGDIRGLQVTLTPYQINATLAPVSDYTDGIMVNVTANNPKTTSDKFKLFYRIDTIDTALIDQGFKYTITKCTSNCSNVANYTVLSAASGNFSSAESNSNMNIYEESVPTNTTYYYKVYLWIDSSAGNQSNMQNKSFVGELRADIGINNTVTDCSNNVLKTTIPNNLTGLARIMAEEAFLDNGTSEYLTACSGVNFNAISSDTNGKGVYEIADTKNDPYPIYYYRGAVTNNNVKFGGFCWKAIRTTDTGGVKMIYNGEPDANGYCTNTTGDATQLTSTSAFNSSSNSPAYVGYMYGTKDHSSTGTPYTYTTKKLDTTDSIGYLYGHSVNYSNGTYTLTNTMAVTASNYNTPTAFNNNHYTCFSTTGACSTVYYVYYGSGATHYYISITGIDPGSSELIDVIKDNMLSNNDKDSTAKTNIDNWFRTNLTNLDTDGETIINGKKDYRSYLEDTIYCNDRTTSVASGWNIDGGMNKYLYFSGNTRVWTNHKPSLTCSRQIDKFTVSPTLGNGKLKYPVGLISTDEAMYAGGRGGTANNAYYLYTSRNYWAFSPLYYGVDYAREISVYSTGSVYSNLVNRDHGLRPVVSLSPTSDIMSGGDGSSDHPYVVAE